VGPDSAIGNSRCRAVGTCAVLLLLLAATPIVTLVTPPSARANETVWACANGVNHVFAHAAVFGINTPSSCPGDPSRVQGIAISTGGNTVKQGQRADWQANAPSGLVIVGASVPPANLYTYGINDGNQYGGGFYWAGGGAQANDEDSSAAFGPLWTSYFGWQVICGVSQCTDGLNWMAVSDIALNVQETVGPSLVAPNGLWQSTGWVRGDWPLNFYGDSPSGLCSLEAIINGQEVAGASSGQDTSTWHQCDAPGVSQTIHTWQDGQGAMPLTLAASDAAGLPVIDTRTIYIDNSQPTISLSGPTDAPSTAGTQYVIASASAGPSGVGGIFCSVDGSPYVAYSGNPARIPVQGIGAHVVQCYAQNQATDPTGARGQSAVESWGLRIRQPTISGITFGSRLLDALRCRSIRVRVDVGAHWVTVRRHGKRVRVHRRSGVRIRREVRCHARVVVREVRVHGHLRPRRVVVLPHTVQISAKRVGFGRSATVTGWVGLSNGTALGGVPVRVMTATDNGRDRWRLATVAATSPDGVWKATLKPGPSRLISAVYPGSDTTEPAASAGVSLSSGTKVSLTIRPRITVWGATIAISGRVLGGNIPAGKLLRLRIGTAGIYSTVGIPNIDRRGHYRTTWTFASGNGTVRYWFSVSTLPEADYPYAQTSSPRVYVSVHG
jgi:hypothetical protein